MKDCAYQRGGKERSELDVGGMYLLLQQRNRGRRILKIGKGQYNVWEFVLFIIWKIELNVFLEIEFLGC